MCGWALGFSNSFPWLCSSAFHCTHDIWTLHVCEMINPKTKLSGSHRINMFQADIDPGQQLMLVQMAVCAGGDVLHMFRGNSNTWKSGSVFPSNPRILWELRDLRKGPRKQTRRVFPFYRTLHEINVHSMIKTDPCRGLSPHTFSHSSGSVRRHAGLPAQTRSATAGSLQMCRILSPSSGVSELIARWGLSPPGRSMPECFIRQVHARVLYCLRLPVRHFIRRRSGAFLRPVGETAATNRCS